MRTNSKQPSNVALLTKLGMMLLSCFAAKKMVVFTMQLVANPELLRYPFFYYSRRIVVSATRRTKLILQHLLSTTTRSTNED